jgi:uncharacterized protein (DUF362 family)
MTRRELFAIAAAAPQAVSAAAQTIAPTAPVSIAKVGSYQEDLGAVMGKMFDQLGGLSRLVNNRTVTIKLNLTGAPALRFQGRPLGSTHYTHPRTLMAMVSLLDRAGAKRIRLVESCWGTGGPMEEYLLDSGWNVRQLKSLSKGLEFENTNARGTGKKYARFKTPKGGHIFSAFDLNEAYEKTDVFVSMAKLKNHATCGVTLSMKNCFGNTPASIYGDDAGVDEPNESPTKGRLDVCHLGKRQPSKCSPGENDPQSSRSPEYRMPRVVADIASARPIDIAFIDGIETMAGGEGPWVGGQLSYVTPGVLVLGTNAVTTDSVATAAMGYDPRATRGVAPFTKCDNSLLLAEAHGVGTTDLKRIEVRGASIGEALFPFPGGSKTRP